MQEVDYQDILWEFATAQGTMMSTRDVISKAGRLVRMVMDANLVQPEISVDIDGALSFDLRLRNGDTFMAEMTQTGYLDFGIYRKKQSRFVHIISVPGSTEEQFQMALSGNVRP